MRIHDAIRQTLARGLNEDSLLIATRLIADVQANGPAARPIVLHTVLTVLEGIWRNWFEDHSTGGDFPPSLEARVVPAIRAVLAADERSDADALLPALDDLARAYQGCIRRGAS